jgi:hypothetical protein
MTEVSGMKDPKNEPVDPAEWTCAKCTFFNLGNVGNVCGLCGDEGRTGDAASRQPRGGVEGGPVGGVNWNCEVCFFVNNVGDEQCSCCSQSRTAPSRGWFW